MVDGTKIKCWSDHSNGKHSNQTLAEALNNSCNPCFTDMALSLGTQTFYSYLTAFGFGNVTGLDFNGEALGMLVPQSLVRDCDLARIGFGQTVAVTGIQLACAVAASVNGGYYYLPRLLKSVVTSDGKAESYKPVVLRHISKVTKWAAKRVLRKSMKTDTLLWVNTFRRFAASFPRTIRSILRLLSLTNPKVFTTAVRLPHLSLRKFSAI